MMYVISGSSGQIGVTQSLFKARYIVRVASASSNDEFAIYEAEEDELYMGLWAMKTVKEEAK